MRIAAFAVALFAVTVGVVGLVSPGDLTAARRHLLDIPGGLYITGSFRLAMGLVLILFATRSRMPKTLRVLGVIMALQGIVPQLIGADRGREILDQQEALLGVAAKRVGAAIALATGCFIAFAVKPRTGTT